MTALYSPLPASSGMSCHGEIVLPPSENDILNSVVPSSPVVDVSIAMRAPDRPHLTADEARRNAGSRLPTLNASDDARRCIMVRYG